MEKIKKFGLILVTLLLLFGVSVNAEEYNAQFSEEQGLNNFYFRGIDNTGNEVELSLFPQSNNPSDKRWRPAVGENPSVAFDGINASNLEMDAAIIFESPKKGNVHLNGEIKFADWITSNSGINVTDGNGVIVKIFKGDELLWEKKIDFKNTASYDINTVVEQGEKLKFVINPNGNVSYDVVVWWPKIEYIPTPSKFAMKFGETQGADNFYYCAFNDGQETFLNLFPQKDNPNDKRWRVSEGQTPSVAFDGMTPANDSDVGTMFVAPMSGEVKLTGEMSFATWITNNSSIKDTDGDGVQLKILKNDIVIWEKPLGFLKTESHDLTMQVAKGDKIKFIIETTGTQSYDVVVWWPMVEYKVSALYYDEYLPSSEVYELTQLYPGNILNCDVSVYEDSFEREAKAFLGVYDSKNRLRAIKTSDVFMTQSGEGATVSLIMPPIDTNEGEDDFSGWSTKLIIVDAQGIYPVVVSEALNIKSGE